MKQALFIEAQYEDDVMIIRPMGTFNCWQLPTIKAVIGTYLMSVQKPQIVINLHHVRFVDSPTFDQLFHWLEKARMFGGDIKLCELNTKVSKLMNVLSGDEHFAVYQSEAQAISAFDHAIQDSKTA